ncbi:MAG: hypothetical protein HWD82_10795 [Flavobacteriaceae bacterium]|nr:hypothetical protein [Flavobacteriaceae bacterium]
MKTLQIGYVLLSRHILLLMFFVSLKLFSQLPPHPQLNANNKHAVVGAYHKYDWVHPNQYDFLSGSPKNTTANKLRLQVYYFTLFDREELLFTYTNMPSEFNDLFVFRPRRSYARKGEGAPYGRGFPASSQYEIRTYYGKSTTFFPPTWEKQNLNWPFGSSGTSSFLSQYYADFYPEARESNSGENSYSLTGAYWSQMYRHKNSSHSLPTRWNYGPGRGSIPNQRDPIVEYFIPDAFWTDHDYFRMETFSALMPNTGRWYNTPNPYMDPNYRIIFGGDWGSYIFSQNSYIFPFVNQSGQKVTLLNNSPVPYDFGMQGAYSNSESFFSSFAQDKEGDLLIYRWEPIVDITNGLNRFNGKTDSYPERYGADQTFNHLLIYTDGYSTSNPIKYDPDFDPDITDDFYINPYSGSVKFFNEPDPTNRQLRLASVAIDQYKDGQLIGTIQNIIPYFPQPFEGGNKRPLISFTSDQNIETKTSFDFDTDIDSKPDLIIPNWSKNPNETRNRISHKQVNNNGEVLLHAMDVEEGGNIKFTINYSDPDNDNVTIQIIPVIPDLFDRYPWTLTDDGNGSAEFEWDVPLDISEFSSLQSYSFMFMVYAEDNGGILNDLNGQNIEPFSITVHDGPGVVISSTLVTTGETTNDQSIPIRIDLTNIESSESGSLVFELEEDDFIITNASISDLEKSEDGRFYTATLNPGTDPESAPVSTSIKLPRNVFNLTKTGGHGINTVEVPNSESNLFEWTSNQIRPTVEFEFFDSSGNSLSNNVKNNSPYIVGKVIPSVLTDNFALGDISLVAENASIGGFSKVVGIDQTYYTFKISADDNTEGTVKFSIDANVFSDNIGNQNLEGNLVGDNSVKLFEWSFDRNRPSVTISNPFENATEATNDLTGQIVFSLSEAISFQGNTLDEVANSTELSTKLIGSLNTSTTNAYFTNFSYNVNTPNQFTATVNHSGGNRTATLICPEGVFLDLYGNKSTEETSSHSYNLNLPRLSSLYNLNKTAQAPYRYSQGLPLVYLTSSSPVELLLGFSGQSKDISVWPPNDTGYEGTWDGRKFPIAPSDFIISSGTISNIQFFGLSEDTDEFGNKEQLFRALYTPASAFNGFVEITHRAESFQNITGNNNIESKKQFILDTNTPSLSLTSFTLNGIPISYESVTNESDLIIELKTSEPIKGLEQDDISFWGRTEGVISNFERLDDSNYRFKVNHFDGDGVYNIDIFKNRFTDLANNPNNSRFNFKWYYDTTSPSVSIEILNGNNPINDNEFVADQDVTIKYVFNESGMHSGPTGEALIQLLNDNASNISFTSASFNSANQIITATGVISDTITSPAEITIDFPKDIFKDRGGNLNTEANQRSFIFDDNVPEPIISLKSTSVDELVNRGRYNVATISVTFQFSEELGALNSSLNLSELESILSSQLPNGTLSNLQQEGNSYIAEVSGYSDGELTIKFPKDLVFTLSGVKNIEATSTVIYDGTPPNAIITVSKGGGVLLDEGSNTNQQNLNVTIVTSEITQDLAIEDLIVTGSVNLSPSLHKVDDYTYSLTLTNTSSGPVTLSLAANKYSDSVGNFNSTDANFSYNFDNIRPIPSITSSGVSGDGVALQNAVPIQLNFSEAVEFSLGNDNLENYISSLVTNGRVSDFSKGEDGTINFIVNRVANGTVSINLPENVFYDTHENGNTSGTYSFDFNNTIELTKVEISSNNSLEQDYTLSYAWGNAQQTRVVPGTRSLFNQGVIDQLYVNNTHSLTFYFESNAEIQDVEISIDGKTYYPSSVNNDPTKWELIYPVSNSSNEGKVEFEIKFSDTTSKLQPLVTETTDNIYYTKDFTPPVFEIQLFRFDENGKTKIEDFTKSLLPVKHSLKLSASETIYDQLAYQNVQGIPANSADKIYKGNLALLAAEIQYIEDKSPNYHNADLYNRITNSVPLESRNSNYYNGDFFNISYTYTSEDLLFHPQRGTSSYSISVPGGYFMDLAGNKSLPASLNNLKLIDSGTLVTSSEAQIEKKSCEYVTSATFSRSRINSYAYTYFETDIIVELSTDISSNSIEILEPYKIREIKRDLRTAKETYYHSYELSIDFELDIDKTSWVRFKTIDRASEPTVAETSDGSGYTEYFQQSYYPYKWEETESYTEWQLITINENPIEVSGVNQICGLGQTESYTVNTSGGSWSVSDETIATIDASSGVLKSIKAGAIEVKYTTADGCTYTKSLEIFNATEVNITANGQVEFCEGNSVKLTADTSKNLVWYKDNDPLPQITSSVLNLENNSDSGSYKVKYNTPCGSIWSNEIRVKVNSKPSPSKVNSTSN